MVFSSFMSMKEGVINISFQLASERKPSVFVRRSRFGLLDRWELKPWTTIGISHQWGLASPELPQSLQSLELEEQGLGVLGDTWKGLEWEWFKLHPASRGSWANAPIALPDKLKVARLKGEVVLPLQEHQVSSEIFPQRTWPLLATSLAVGPRKWKIESST